MAKKRAAKVVGSPNPFGSPASKKGKSDKDDDDKEPIKPSPLLKKKGATSKKRGPPTMKIIHVVPKVSHPVDATDVLTGEEGFTILINGFMQNIQVRCIFEKNGPDPIPGQFCDATDPITHVFSYEDEDTPIMQEGNNGAMYQIKLVCFKLDGDEIATQELLTQFAEETFVPALMRHRRAFPSARPIMDPEVPYVQVPAWNKILGNGNGLLELFSFAYKEGSETFGAWIKADHANLYSLFPIGQVPEFVKQNYVLTNEHLLPPDIPHLLAALPAAMPVPAQPAPPQAKGQEDSKNEEEKNNDE